MTIGAGGLPAPRPDQAQLPAGDALQAGSSSTVRARFVIVSGTNGGVFVYTGIPAAGDLAVSIAGTAGTDPIGLNTTLAGVGVYGASGSYANIATNNGFKGFPALTLNPPGMAHVTDLPQLASDNVNPGAANEQAKLTLSSGKENHLDDGAIQLFAESNDATIGAAVVVEFGGTITVTINRGGFFLTGNNYPYAIIPGNTTQTTDFPRTFLQVNNAGAANEQLLYVITSGKENSLDDAAIQLFSEPANAVGQATAVVEFGGTVATSTTKTQHTVSVPITATAGTAAAPTVITSDSWHPIVLDANWSTLGGQPIPSYRRGIEKQVHLTGAAQFNVNIANTNLNGGNPLPASYRPLTAPFLAAAPGSAGLNVLTNGVLVAAQGTATTPFCNFNGSYPLDL